MLLDAFDSILEYNGISLDLYFKTLNPFEGEKSEEPTQLSKQFNLEDYLNEIGEDIPDGYIVIDERDVEEVEDEDVLNAYLEELEAKLTKEEPTLMSKVWNFVSTGTARPTARSSQDKQVKDKFFKVRYKYTGNKNPERAFCKAMMNAGKLYRKEDIDNMASVAVNKGFGEFGSDTYDIFKYKGGARCRHKFQRVTMMVDLNEDNPQWKDIGTRAAEIKGFKVTNPFEVSVYPNNLPLKGFSPNNKNLPKDVK
jgi:hypothetical protein